jgi:perosamine synthetase
LAIPLMKPFFSETCKQNISRDIHSILESGRLMLGPFAEKLEAEFRKSCSTHHAISVNSCTTALEICLRHFEVAGHEVLVPSGSFVTDVSVVQWANATPVLVDMNPRSLSFDLDDLRRKVSPRTKAIIWVHLAGYISKDYQEIVEFARERALILIEDCAHALGANVDGKPAGSLGDAACYSFYPTKIITSGTGGMITTNDPELDRVARELRVFGRNPESGAVDKIGSDWFLDELRACVAFHQMLDLDAMVTHRRQRAALYDRLLSNQPRLRLFDTPPTSKPSYYQYPVLLDPDVDRASVMKGLKERHSIQAKPIYLPTHREKIFRHLDDG